MHPNPAFRQEPDALHMNMVRWRGFGTLIVPNGAALPLISHVPFLLNEAGTELELHLVRSNPIFLHAQSAVPAMMVVSGPDGYVSPDWYEDAEHKQVPTWNYVAVHLSGSLAALGGADLRDHLDRLSEGFEERLAPKPVWKSTKMPKGTMERMMRAIGVFRFRVDGVEGTWKLNQNKTAEQRDAASDQMKHSAVGHETKELSQLMKGIGPRAPWD